MKSLPGLLCDVAALACSHYHSLFSSHTNKYIEDKNEYCSQLFLNMSCLVGLGKRQMVAWDFSSAANQVCLHRPVSSVKVFWDGRPMSVHSQSWLFHVHSIFSYRWQRHLRIKEQFGTSVSLPSIPDWICEAFLIFKQNIIWELFGKN